VRTELKKKTGIEVNEFGVRKELEKPEELVFENKDTENSKDKGKERKKSDLYTPIASYKPSGNLF